MDESNPDWAPTLHLGHCACYRVRPVFNSIQLNSKALLSIPTEGRKLSLDKGTKTVQYKRQSHNLKYTPSLFPI